jgi:hypothetical protein
MPQPNSDSILPQPDQMKPLIAVQGGGARIQTGGKGKKPVSIASSETEETNNYNANSENNSDTKSESDSESNSQESQNISNFTSVNTYKRQAKTNVNHQVTPSKLVMLEKGFRVRAVDNSIKQEIMDLDFIPEEQRLFEDYLKFDKAFVKEYISSSPQTKEDFYEFWKLFVEKDGTDGYTLMTKVEGRKLQAYMENIVYAHRDYLIKSALRLLRKQDNPEHFEDTVSTEPKDGFIFTEVQPRETNDNDWVNDNAESTGDEDEEEEEDEDEEQEEEQQQEQGQEQEEQQEKEEDTNSDRLKNIFTHIHTKIITLSSSDTSEEKVIKLLEYLLKEFDYTDANKDSTISLLSEFIGCTQSKRGKLVCDIYINYDLEKFTCKTFLDKYNKAFNLSKILKMSYDEYKKIFKWLIEHLFLISIVKTPAEYKEVMKSRLVYFYSRCIESFLGHPTRMLLFIATGVTYKLYTTRDKLPELPETLQPKKKKQAAQDK